MLESCWLPQGGGPKTIEVLEINNLRIGFTFMNCPIFLRSLAISLFFSSTTAFATTPLFDKIEIEGKQGDIQQIGIGWLNLPDSEKLREIMRAERCSAIGGPRGEYKIENGKLWLYSLYRCSGKISLSEVYPEQSEPMLATWVNGDLFAQVGKPVCMSSKGWFFIYENEISMRIETGNLKSIQSKRNSSHPDCRRDPQ
jgi:hypothetical protein